MYNQKQKTIKTTGDTKTVPGRANKVSTPREPKFFGNQLFNDPQKADLEDIHYLKKENQKEVERLSEEATEQIRQKNEEKQRKHEEELHEKWQKEQEQKGQKPD